MRLISTFFCLFIVFSQLAFGQTPSLETSEVFVSPVIIPVSGTARITVQLKDANGNNVTTGGASVTFASPNSGTIGSVTDNGNGIYTATYTASSSTGTISLIARVSGNDILNTTSVTVATAGSAFVLDGTNGSNRSSYGFSTTGDISIGQGFFLDYLIVGGGGGWGGALSGTAYNAGGGGGKVQRSTMHRITNFTNYSIVVGSGGVGAGSATTGEGGTSSAFGIEAIGGVQGGRTRPITTTQSGVGGASGSGFSGGAKANPGTFGGGGGGETAVGGQGQSTRGGNGGAGIRSAITGIDLMYGFGGGGGSAPSSTASSTNGDGTTAASRSNSGGGGRVAGGPTGVDADGARGVVYLRFRGTEPNPDISTTANPTSILGGDYQLYSFTSGTTSFDLTNVELGSILTEPIGGSGNLIYTGPGRLTLTQNSTYNGSTTVNSGGNLQIGQGGSTGSLGAGSITSNGILTINRNNEYTLPGVVSGTGTLRQEGSGTLNLGGFTHTVSNVSLVDGTMSNGTLSNTLFTATGGTLSAVLTGTSSLVKSGTGTFFMTGNNSYSGTTSISAGTLVNTGNQTAATGSVTVHSGATLKGTGIIGGATTINSGGTIRPGMDVGTLNFASTVTLAGGGNYNWQITDAAPTAGAGTGWSLIQAAGDINITATPANPFSINIWSVLANGSNGEPDNFRPTEQSYSWTIMSSATNILNFDATDFVINSSPVNGTGGLTTPYPSNGFSVVLSQNGKEILLVYSPPVSQILDGTANPTNASTFTTNTSNNSLTLQLGLFADVLVVGGGSGAVDKAGNNYNAGGGGGGVEYRSGLNLSQQNYTITVGAGGGLNTSGGNSSAFGIMAPGGQFISTNEPGSSGNGFAGGTYGFDGGGGGGAGGPGKSHSYLGYRHGGDGGQGILSDITGTSLMYGFGGGGGGTNAFRSPTSLNGDGSSAPPRANSGGGANARISNSGAAGIVIVRYAGGSLGSIGGTISSVAGYTTHTFINNGTFNLSQADVDLNARLRHTISGNIIGNGNLIINSTGMLTLTGTGHTYSGSTSVTAGHLRVNSSISSSSGVTVASGAILSGTGTLPRTTISGTHAPGTSPGVQTISGDLTYNTGATFQWELAANDATATDRGVEFDGVDVSGALTIQTGVTSSLVFNGTGSAVDWTDPFWSTNHQWLVFSGASSTAITDGTVFRTISVSADKNGVLLNSLVTRDFSTFSWSQVGNNIYLNYTAASSLPVTWKSFTGREINKQVELNWATAAEWNNAHFDVERSADGQRFTAIGRVKAIAAPGSDNRYRFLDEQPLTGRNMYRLKQVDLDGKYAYSDLLTFQLSGLQQPRVWSDGQHWQVFIPGNQVVPLTLRMFDASGGMIREQTIYSGQTTLSVGHLPSGIYLIRITRGKSPLLTSRMHK